MKIEVQSMEYFPIRKSLSNFLAFTSSSKDLKVGFSDRERTWFIFFLGVSFPIHCLTASIAVAVVNYHCQEQCGEERVYYTLQLSGGNAEVFNTTQATVIAVGDPQ